MNKIGQFRSSKLSSQNNENFITLTPGVLYNSITEYVRFEDPYLYMASNQKFIKDIPYYAIINLSLNLNGSNIDSSYYSSDNQMNYKQDIDYTIILQSSDGSQKQKIKTVHIAKEKISFSGNQSFPVEVVFTPNMNYDNIVFEITRINEDYKANNLMSGNTISEFNFGRRFIISGKYKQMVDIFKITDSNSKLPSGVKQFNRIGIQGRQGLNFIINDEPIMIGRTGIFEINDPDIKIQNLSFVPVDTAGNNSFIIDYTYNS